MVRIEVFICFFVSCLAVVATTPVNNNHGLKGLAQPKIKPIVSVDGKTFYAEDLPRRNRNDASNYCKSLGLKLASITSLAQLQALKNAYSIEFMGEYWTSGITARASRAYNWEGTNTQPDSYLRMGGGDPILNGLTYKQCQTDCETIHPNKFDNTWGVLCEK